MYIYQHKDWPNLYYDQSKLSPLLAEVRYLQGKLLGGMINTGFHLKEEATLKILTEDVIKTSEIEGEKLEYQEVRSSIAKRLGIDIGGIRRIDRNIEGITEIMVDATRNYNMPLTKERLFNWHQVFPTGRNGMKIMVGKWRDDLSGPMQVISGPIGREKVHYEAPSYERLDSEMDCFINWFNNPGNQDDVINSAIAHFWFVTIHPFDDGNGIIARALADRCLVRSEGSMERFYSMSSQIQKERNNYYDILEKCQKGTPDITLWVEWFLNCLKRAILISEEILSSVLIKARFWEANVQEDFNNRQKFMINNLLDGFEGKLTSSKWAKICKCSQDTALRDISDLVAKQILLKDNAGGRSTSYYLNYTTIHRV